MLDFDKMTVAEHEAYKEMQRKAELAERVHSIYRDYLITGDPDKFVSDMRGVMEG